MSNGTVLRWFARKRELFLVAARSRFYARLLGACGGNLRVYGRITVHHPERVSMGRDCTVNEHCLVHGRGTVRIGNRVRLSSGCMLLTAGLDAAREADAGGREHVAEPIVLEDDVWIGAGAIVLPGVTVGRGSVVGAGAVVTKDVPAGVTAVGVPAKALQR